MLTSLLRIERSPCWKFSTEVKQICQPLMDKFGINYFDYARFYPDNTSIQLFTEPDYIKFLLTDKEFKCPPGRVHEGKHLWQSYIPSHFLDRIEAQFNHYHGITYVRVTAEYTELINFSAPKNNEQILTIFMNYEEALEYFVSFFTKKIEHFIKKNTHNRIILPEDFLGERAHKTIKELTVNEFVKSLKNKVDNFYLMTMDNKHFSLTSRETQLLSFLTHGWSTKKIALKLDISMRTVDNHFNNIMKKINVSNRIELLGKLDVKTINLLRILSM